MTTGPQCPRCGTIASPGARFCGTCGAPLAAPAEAPEDQLLVRLRQATLGEYDVLRELGRGGMAAVYLAWDRDLARHVAVKVLLPELAHHPGMSQRFLQEARTAANLDDHPSVVRVYRAKEADGLRYFVMKFVDGCSLEQLLRASGPLPPELAAHIIDQVALALQYAHEHGVVHRDVKPGNVLLDRAGGVIVTDFGIAKVAEAESLTRTGLAIGTPHYMSPEQWRVEPLTSSSDQYALGVVAHQLITGSVPFDGTQYEIQEGHLRLDPPALYASRPNVPPALEGVVSIMLAKRPEERFADLHSVSRALADVPRDPVPVLRSQLAARIAQAVPDGVRVLTPAGVTPTTPSPAFARPTPVRPTPVPATPAVGAPAVAAAAPGAAGAVAGGAVAGGAMPVSSPASPAPAWASPAPVSPAPISPPSVTPASVAPSPAAPVTPDEVTPGPTSPPPITPASIRPAFGTPAYSAPAVDGFDRVSTPAPADAPRPLADVGMAAAAGAGASATSVFASSAPPAVSDPNAGATFDAASDGVPDRVAGTAGDEPRPAPKPRRLGLALAAGAVAVIAGGAVWMSRGSGDEPAPTPAPVATTPAPAAVAVDPAPPPPAPPVDTASLGGTTTTITDPGPDPEASAAPATPAPDARVDTTPRVATRLVIVGAPAGGQVGLAVGDSLRLVARVDDNRGQRMRSARVRWTSSDPSRVAFRNNWAVGVAAGGPVAVSAASGPLRGEVQVQVTPRAAVAAAPSAAAASSAVPSDAEVQQAIRSFVAALGARDFDALGRRLAARAQDGSSSREFLDWMRGASRYSVGAPAAGQVSTATGAPRVSIRVPIRYGRGGIVNSIGSRDATFYLTLARDGDGWHAGQAVLASRFRP